MRTEQTFEKETSKIQRAGSLKVSVRSIACSAGTRLIPLTQGKFAIVDAEDYKRLSHFGGRYKSEKTAGRVYNLMAKKFFGQFACLNSV